MKHRRAGWQLMFHELDLVRLSGPLTETVATRSPFARWSDQIAEDSRML